MKRRRASSLVVAEEALGLVDVGRDLPQQVLCLLNDDRDLLVNHVVEEGHLLPVEVRLEVSRQPAIGSGDGDCEALTIVVDAPGRPQQHGDEGVERRAVRVSPTDDLGGMVVLAEHDHLVSRLVSDLAEIAPERHLLEASEHRVARRLEDGEYLTAPVRTNLRSGHEAIVGDEDVRLGNSVHQCLGHHRLELLSHMAVAVRSGSHLNGTIHQLDGRSESVEAVLGQVAEVEVGH